VRELEADPIPAAKLHSLHATFPRVADAIYMLIGPVLHA